MDYTKKKEELKTKHEELVKQLEGVNQEIFRIQGEYRLIEQIEKEAAAEAVEPKDA